MTDESEPDRVYYSSPLSRRDALALGGAGLTTALAGCSGMSDPSAGDPSSPPSQSGDRNDESGASGNGNEDRQSVYVVEVGLSEIEYQVMPRESLREELRDDNSIEYTMRLYTTPLHAPSQTRLTERTITVESTTDSFTASYEFPEETLNQAQQFVFTLEVNAPQEIDEFQAYRTGKVLLPYYNQALGETKLIVPSAPAPSPTDWNSELTPITKTQVWFNEPDGEKFNTPDVSEYYPRHWYGDYTDLEITIVVRYPVYHTLENNDHPAYETLPRKYEDEEVPLFDWAVFNFDIAGIEMIEARRWNSWVLQQIERGRFELTDDEKAAKKPSGVEIESFNDRGGLLSAGNFYWGDATETPKPFEMYYRSRYGSVYDGGPQSPDSSPINPMHFAGGRPVMKRWAQEMEDSLSNNDNFQNHPAQDYYKATILKSIIGHTPYAFSVGRYRNTPEELILNWYKSQEGDESLGANCVAATTFFTGVGVHLLNSSVGVVHMTGSNVDHLQAGVISLEKPYLPESINDDQAKGLISDSDARYGSEYGRFTPVECNFQAATIGYNQRVGSEYSLRLRTYASNMDINSHIPVNENYEPDIDGEVLADRDPIQNAFLIRNTVVEPSPRPWFEKLQED